MVQQGVILEALDIQAYRGAGATGQVNHGIFPFAVLQAVGITRVLVFRIPLEALPSPARVQLDEVQLDHAAGGVFPVFRHLQKPALDLAGFVVDFSLEGTHEAVDPVAVAGEQVHRLNQGHIGLDRRFDGLPRPALGGQQRSGHDHGHANAMHRELLLCLSCEHERVEYKCLTLE